MAVRKFLSCSCFGPWSHKKDSLLPLLPDNTSNIRIQQLWLPKLTSLTVLPQILRFFNILITLPRKDSSLPMHLLQCGAQDGMLYTLDVARTLCPTLQHPLFWMLHYHCCLWLQYAFGGYLRDRCWVTLSLQSNKTLSLTPQHTHP